MRVDDIYRLLASLRLVVPGSDAARETSDAIENLLSESSVLSLVDHGLIASKGASVALAQAQSYATLVSIDLSHNGLGDRGITALFGGLAGRRSQLHTIKLASCRISDVGLLSIVQHCLLPNPPRMPNLRQLFLNNNSIELNNPTAALLTSALSHRASQLRRLNLTSNPIKGLRPFLKNLTSRCLRSLQLNACMLSDEDGKALFEWVLDPANPLIRLELNANLLSVDVMQLFTMRLRETGLQHVELLANLAAAPLWQPVRFAHYEMEPHDANRYFAHQLRREALGMLACARIVSQARPGSEPWSADCYPILQLPVEIRQRIVLHTMTSELTAFHMQRRTGIFLSEGQFARIWAYSADRGTLVKSTKEQRARFRTEEEREEFLDDEKESYLMDVRCLKMEPGRAAGDA